MFNFLKLKNRLKYMNNNIIRYLLYTMGKIHGSLARAGKVKNSTPRGCVLDKKKQKTGRSRKRELYNSRFNK
jgi:small subunit ribosomal protein S30e